MCDYDEAIEQLKEAILRESRKYNKLINPLNSDSKNILGIMCTWNMLFKAMSLAEKEWKENKILEWWFSGLEQNDWGENVVMK